MLRLDDERWKPLKGAYGVLFDPRPLLTSLRSANGTGAIWQELWTNLYHQGDVGEASYAAVTQLISLAQEGRLLDWNAYALTAAIELARDHPQNPKVPQWLQLDYEEAFQRLVENGLSVFPGKQSNETDRSILSILALSKGLRTYARVLLEFTEDEIGELAEQASEQDAV